MKISFTYWRKKLIRWLKKKKEGDLDDPLSALKGIAWAYGLYYGGWLVVVLAGLAILSFTSWLGGPFVAAQVIFGLIVGTLLIVLLNGFVFWRTLKGNWETGKERDARDVSATNKSGDDNIRDAQIIDTPDDVEQTTE